MDKEYIYCFGRGGSKNRTYYSPIVFLEACKQFLEYKIKIAENQYLNSFQYKYGSINYPYFDSESANRNSILAKIINNNK